MKNQRVQKFFKGKGRTVSEPGRMGPIADSVNRLLRGESIMGNGRVPLPAGDYTGVPTLSESMTIHRRAIEQFEALPSRVRSRFNNDPEQLNQFLLNCDDPKFNKDGSNKYLDEAYEIGLRNKPKDTPAPAPVTLSPETIQALKGGDPPVKE